MSILQMSTLGGKETVAANRAGLRQRIRAEPVPELSLAYNLSIENRREIEERKERINEVVYTMWRFHSDM
jgi:hypothetical protein